MSYIVFGNSKSRNSSTRFLRATRRDILAKSSDTFKDWFRQRIMAIAAQSQICENSSWAGFCGKYTQTIPKHPQPHDSFFFVFFGADNSSIYRILHALRDTIATSIA